jgi:D-glycero-D-manno-heptose 1,7-bisphosphate phosphatase
MTPAIFLDRDGVIIRNRPGYVRDWSDVHIYPQAIDILNRVSSLPYRIVVVTNQSAIGRGLVTMSKAQEINQRLRREVQRAGGRIDRIYMCPHSPKDNCDCRKPKPGLLLQAAEELSLDLRRSLMVGDALTDLEAARVAGVPTRGLVRTGRGNGQLALPEATRLQPLAVYDGLAAALEDMLAPVGFSQEAAS